MLFTKKKEKLKYLALQAREYKEKEQEALKNKKIDMALNQAIRLQKQNIKNSKNIIKSDTLPGKIKVGVGTAFKQSGQGLKMMGTSKKSKGFFKGIRKYAVEYTEAQKKK